eukprot:jgi/Galph1/5714/GphlegSOOS_G4345.1
MTGFSLRLLQHSATKDWLNERIERSLSPFAIERSIPLESIIEVDYTTIREKFLIVPVELVDRMLMGSTKVVGEPPNIMKTVGQENIFQPSCRRFALDLDKKELVEIPTDEHCISYSIVYECPPDGKLPHKLFKSIEMVSSRLVSESIPLKSRVDNETWLLSQIPEIFYGIAYETIEGVMRTTKYSHDDYTIVKDDLTLFQSRIQSISNADMIRFQALESIRISSETNNLPFIVTKNASEGIRQLLSGHQKRHQGNSFFESSQGLCEEPFAKKSTSKDYRVVSNCNTCQYSSLSVATQSPHLPSWTRMWNSLHKEDFSFTESFQTRNEVYKDACDSHRKC